MFSHSRLSFSRPFSDEGIVRVTFAVAIEFEDELTWWKFFFVFTAEDVLMVSPGYKDDGEPCFVEDAA